MKDQMIIAHQHSIYHLSEIEASQWCGCFLCRSIFETGEIEDWCDDGDTALCPRCGCDAVIGDASGLPVRDIEFLGQMNRYYF